MQPASHQIASEYSAQTPVAPGVILLIASLGEVLAMAHHPTVETAEISQAIAQIVRLSALSAIIHGVLIALMLSIVYGLAAFSAGQGLHRPLIRAGAIAYGCGVLVMVGAALVSGFITPDLASVLPHATAIDLQINRQLLLLCRVLNQSCANFAVVAMSAGILCWSLDLGRNPGSRRAVGVLGCLVGLVPALALMFGKIHLDVHGMSQVVVTQAAWNMAVAALMIFSKRNRDLETTTRPVEA